MEIVEMTDLITYNGDHLLEVFENLNINLGDLDPNVIRAWFDTDDQDVKNLLCFMCSGLTRENIVTAQEIAEFESLEKPLSNNNLDNAFDKIEQEKPGILDFELNSKQLEVLRAEIKLLEHEEQKLDELLDIDERLKQTLLHKKLKIERQAVELDFKQEEASKICERLSGMVDEKNQCLHAKLSKDLIALANFQCDDLSDFFNRKNLSDINDADDFHAIIEDLVRKQHDELSGYFSLSNINLNSTPNDENPENKLVIMQHQIYSSYLDYMEAKMEEESLSEVNNYLDNFFTQEYLINNVSSCSDSTKQKELLLSKLHKKAGIMAEEPIVSIKLNKLQKEYKKMQEDLKCFSQISKYYSKLLSTTSCFLMLLLDEKKMIEDTDEVVRHISKYILHNLEDVKDRTAIMTNLIQESNDFNRRPLEDRSRILKIIVDIYGETTLKEAFISYDQLNKNIKAMEHKLFVNSNVNEIVEKLYKTDVTKQFLTCGQTRKPIIISRPILKSLKNIRCNLEKQAVVLKFLLQISNQTLKKLGADKWLKNSRLVWMYFLVAPTKLKDFLDRIEQEFKCKEIKAVRFKD